MNEWLGHAGAQLFPSNCSCNNSLIIASLQALNTQAASGLSVSAKPTGLGGINHEAAEITQVRAHLKKNITLSADLNKQNNFIA